jgi:hypothetical protein
MAEFQDPDLSEDRATQADPSSGLRPSTPSTDTCWPPYIFADRNSFPAERLTRRQLLAPR